MMATRDELARMTFQVTRSEARSSDTREATLREAIALLRDFPREYITGGTLVGHLVYAGISADDAFAAIEALVELHLLSPS